MSSPAVPATSITDTPLPAARPPRAGRPGLDLFLASGLVLFLELACIRWFPAHVLFLTFFTNAVLLACFVGMSIGCLLADRPTRYIATTPRWLAIALAAGVATLLARPVLERYVSVGGQANPDVVFYGAEIHAFQQLEFAVPAEVVFAIFFVLIARLMVGPGQEMGRAFNRVPDRPRAYALNLLGSLAGILLFAAGSLIELPPLAWFAVAAGGLLYFVRGQWAYLTLAVLLTVGTSGVVPRVATQICWSPYYRIDYTPATGAVATNLIGHQTVAGRDQPVAELYPLPYLFQRDVTNPAGAPAWPAFQRVLIIGAGTGNDLSRACQWLPPTATIDAVEIDPAIRRLGAAVHPDRPYQDPRLTAHLDDGRHFLRTAPAAEYDLVVFALIDSLVLQSGYSNLRLESYLYTREAFADVRRVLKPTGVAAVYNFFRQGWIVARMREDARAAFGGSDPAVLAYPPKDAIKLNDADHGFTVLVAGGPEPMAALRRSFAAAGNSYWYPEYQSVPTDSPAGFVTRKPAGDGWVRLRLADVEESGGSVRSATDDWPFLYTREPAVPAVTLRGIGLMLVVSAGLWAVFRRWEGLPVVGRPAGDGGLLARAFLLGAGFMLVETKAVVHMALLFGSTWMVNTVVFAAVLLMSLAGNLWAGWAKPKNLMPYYGLLFAALGVNLAVPLEALLGFDRPVQLALAGLLAFAPVAVAGVIFAGTFARAPRPAALFGANVAGALVGGLAENLSVVLGFQLLAVVALGFYAGSAVVGNRVRPVTAG